MRAHDARRRYHMDRLSAGRPAPRTMRELLNFPSDWTTKKQRAGQLRMGFLTHR